MGGGRNCQSWRGNLGRGDQYLWSANLLWPFLGKYKGGRLAGGRAGGGGVEGLEVFGDRGPGDDE